MSSDNPLLHHTATAEQGAGFLAQQQGCFATLRPLTQSAEVWLHTHLDAEASWLGDTLVIEHGYFPAIADAVIAAGFTFERDPLPN